MKIYPFPKSRALVLNFSDNKICATLTPLPMNEQRHKDYFNLIQRLLNCRSDDEVREILAATQDLIDAGLVQKMLEMASNLLRQGELDLVVLPKRWLVERTFGWFNWCRRLSKDYEILPETTETFVYVAMIRLMLKQLA